MIATKYQDDEFLTNSFYAKVGGVSLEDLNNFEKYFLNFANYKLFVDQQMFEDYAYKLYQFNEINNIPCFDSTMIKNEE